MPGQGRLGDKANIEGDAHGCPGCPHPGLGPAISGSTDVFVNGRPALRVDDVGLHAACCGGNQWRAQAGSATVFINGRPAHRMGDATAHCGGQGRLTEGSANVFVGDATSGGGSAGGGSAGAAASGGAVVSATSAAASGGAVVSATSAGSRNAGSGAGAASEPAPVAPLKAEPAADAVPPAPPLPDDFIVIELHDDGGEPCAGERYCIVLPDGSERRGALDGAGRAKVVGVRSGECTVTFPDLDRGTWDRSDG